MIIIATHASLINGNIYEAPSNTLVEILASQKQDFVFIRHSLDGKLRSTAYLYRNGEVSETIPLWVISQPTLLRYVTEVVATVIFCFGLRTLEKPSFVGVDPLNAFCGIILTRLGRFKKAVFFTSDYSVTRFKNKFLNWAYHAIDRFTIQHADSVWNVSSRIRQVRKKMGVSDARNVYLPNVPSPDYEAYLSNKKDKFTLVTLGVLADQLDFEGILKAVADLSNEHGDIKLKIIGSGPKQEEIKGMIKRLGLTKRVSLLGHLTHDRALEEISKSGIGLALYNGQWGFNYYGDSMKCREYFCFGLPVLTTDTHSTVEDIRQYQAGIVSDMKASAYVTALKEILNNYDRYSKNSLVLRDKFAHGHVKALKELDA